MLHGGWRESISFLFRLHRIAVDWTGARQKKKRRSKKGKRNCGCVRRFVSAFFFFPLFFFCFWKGALTNTLETLVGGGERFLQLTDDEFRFFFVRRCCVIEGRGQTKRRVWWLPGGRRTRGIKRSQPLRRREWHTHTQSLSLSLSQTS